MNNKKRKLQYIRDKNHLRLGGNMYSILSVSNEICEDEEYVFNTLESEVKHYSNKYKLNLCIDSLVKGMSNDDFLINCSTFKMCINLNNSNK